MRQSINPFHKPKMYEIKEMTEKSDFSIDEQINSKPQKNTQFVINQDNQTQKNNDTSLAQRQTNNFQLQEKKSPTKTKTRRRNRKINGLTKINSNNNISMENDYNANHVKKNQNIHENEKQLTSQSKNQSQQFNNTPSSNSNNKFTMFTAGFYLLILIYFTFTFIILLPSLVNNSNISKPVAAVFGVGLLLNFLFILFCFEKARRLSPGYPPKISQILGLQERSKEGSNIESIILEQQINVIKNNTIQLLIEKAELKQTYDKNPTKQNFLKIHQFQYKFLVESTKFCQKCNNVKLPRVRHCSECNRCVERMDHHCVWLNNCVGRGNHKFFMLFLFFLLIGLTFYLVIAIVDFIGLKGDLIKFVQTQYGKFAKFCYFFLEISAVALWFYYFFVFSQQIYLIANNLTFVESLTKILKQRKPWKKSSICENFSQVFGRGCWLWPSQPIFRKDLQIYQQGKINKKSSSGQLVEQAVQSQVGGNLTNFESQNQLKHQKNDI